MSNVRNPIFARCYTRLSEKVEPLGVAAHRCELLQGLGGSVIELGAGNGMNFRHYPASIKKVVAVEPEPYLRERAYESAADCAVPVHVVDGEADALPFNDHAFDAGIVSLVLCTVPDQHRALSELFRVIRTGGELRFYEHVRSSQPGYGRLQTRAAAVWPFFAGGCRPDRRTGEAIERAGFVVERMRRFVWQPSLVEVLTAPRIIGVARRP
jgi:ubiquinone/menaquinone biosynthesis C-methylase UbiE